MLNSIGITFLIMMVINFLLEITLNFLNLQHLKKKAGQLPLIFRDQIDLRTYEKTINYNFDYGKLYFLEISVSFLIIIYFVFLGGFAQIDSLARSFAPQGNYLSALIFGAIVFLIKTLVNLPFDLYHTFVIEERYGFNRTTPKVYLSDLMKSFTLSALIGIPLYLGIIWFMNRAGNFWWIWCWFFIEAIQILLLIVYPVWIAPLFNKFTPIQDGELKNEIISLSEKVDFPFQGIFIMDGSKRSRHSNAYFTGLGKKKRIVLFDTLIQQMKVPQILAVLAHEFGHYKLHHLKKVFVLNSLLSLTGLYFLSHLFRLNSFYRGFGFTHPSNYAALVIFSLCISALSFLFIPFFSVLSRRFEYQADEFAVKNLKNPKSLSEAIVVLTRENLMNLNPHPWYSFFHYTHPSPVERVKAIENAINKLMKKSA